MQEAIRISLVLSHFTFCRHDKYKDQYRSLFAENCSVSEHEAQLYEDKIESSADADGGQETTPTVYLKVRCDVCNNQVGLYRDEVFFFFGVLCG
jgi:hypothetical protein